MSKQLNTICISLLSLTLLSGCINTQSQKKLRSTGWTKAGAPVAVQLQEIKNEDHVIEIEAQIRSTVPNVKLEWVLPEGATLSQGSYEDDLTITDSDSIIKRRVVISFNDNLSKPYVVVKALTGPSAENFGASTAIRIAEPNKQEQAKIERIQEHMKARNSKPVE